MVAQLLTQSETPWDSPSDHEIKGLTVVTNHASSRNWTPRLRQVRRGTEAIRLHYWWAEKHFIITEVVAKNARMGISALPPDAHTYGR